jgi:uncharacterized protein YkwD
MAAWHRVLPVIALAIGLGLPGPGWGAGLPKQFHKPIAPGPLDQGLFNAAVLVFANEARRRNGRKPLETDVRLVRAAAGHAGNMAKLRTHSHRLPVRGQQRLVQRMDRQALTYRTAGENIAMEKVYRLTGRPISLAASGCRFTYHDTREPVPVHSYASLAQAAVARWMASPKHREALLSRSFGRVGTAFAIDPSGPACGDVYLVQNFAD